MSSLLHALGAVKGQGADLRAYGRAAGEGGGHTALSCLIPGTHAGQQVSGGRRGPPSSPDLPSARTKASQSLCMRAGGDRSGALSRCVAVGGGCGLGQEWVGHGPKPALWPGGDARLPRPTCPGRDAHIGCLRHRCCQTHGLASTISCLNSSHFTSHNVRPGMQRPGESEPESSRLKASQILTIQKLTQKWGQRLASTLLRQGHWRKPAGATTDQLAIA